MPFNPLTIMNGAIDSAKALGAKGLNGGAVRAAIANASASTGVDFNYLLGQARLESGLRADAKAGTSSATGLYQFVDQSWLRVVKAHGAEHGLGWAADAISVGANGKASVADPATRRAILDLRKDPTAASLMAAEHASDNKAQLKSALGRDATGTDLYMAHFLGLGGARAFLSAMQTSPDQKAAALFPAAAHGNRSVFYDAGGQARSLAQVYNRFASKLDQSGGAGGMIPAVATHFQQGLSATRLGEWDADVIPGTGEQSTSDAAIWAHTTLERLTGGSANPFAQNGRVQSANLLRPTPENARLAYMMLASMGA